jgi:hypothetical protein
VHRIHDEEEDEGRVKGRVETDEWKRRNEFGNAEITQRDAKAKLFGWLMGRTPSPRSRGSVRFGRIREKR